AFIALTLGKADLVSVVVSPCQSNGSSASILACRFASQRARSRFARYWARRTGCAVKADARSQLVFAPIAPLPHGRSETIGRLVANPGDGRAFDGLPLCRQGAVCGQRGWDDETPDYRVQTFLELR
ncbi:MAG: hypothetical protein GY803_12460, partial [Chloroflexi bacterium]|nr:hypothetical protein [Chloroflexota bacterium]